jgi:hypothetical protein
MRMIEALLAELRTDSASGVRVTRTRRGKSEAVEGFTATTNQKRDGSRPGARKGVSIMVTLDEALLLVRHGATAEVPLS